MKKGKLHWGIELFLCAVIIIAFGLLMYSESVNPTKFTPEQQQIITTSILLMAG
jgi:hypothetical protein